MKRDYMLCTRACPSPSGPAYRNCPSGVRSIFCAPPGTAVPVIHNSSKSCADIAVVESRQMAHNTYFI